MAQAATKTKINPPDETYTNGITSPEELITAVQSACFAMSFLHSLTQVGTPRTQLHTSAEVDFQRGTGATEICLHVSGEVPSLTVVIQLGGID